MNRNIPLQGLALVLFLLASRFIPVQAQDMITLFTNLPDSMLPLVSAKTRGALLLSSARPATAKNTLDGTVRLDTVSDNYLRLQPAGNSRFEMLLLPATANGENVVAIIETVAAPAEDSKISFFTTEWQPLPSGKYFSAPTKKDFLSEGAATGEPGRWFHPSIIGYRYDLSEGKLIAECRPELYMPKEQYDKLKTGLRTQPIIYRWKNGRFIKE